MMNSENQTIVHQTSPPSIAPHERENNGMNIKILNTQ